MEFQGGMSSFGQAEYSKTESGYKNYIMPRHKEMVPIANEIQRRLANEPLILEFGMRLVPGCFKTYTVVAKYLEVATRELSKRAINHTDAEVTIADIFIMTRSSRFKESNEKTGNIDPVFIPGPITERLIAHDKIHDELFFPSQNGKIQTSSDEYQTAMTLQALCAKELLAYQITLRVEDMCIFIITLLYLKNAVEVLIDMIEAAEDPSEPVVYLIYDLLEIRARRNDAGELKVTFHPGALSKTLIKSDSTEMD